MWALSCTKIFAKIFIFAFVFEIVFLKLGFKYINRIKQVFEQFPQGWNEAQIFMFNSYGVAEQQHKPVYFHSSTYCDIKQILYIIHYPLSTINYPLL